MKKVISVYWVVPALFWLEGGVEVGAGVLEQVEHQLEAFGAFVVGVGHVVVACCQCAELHHAHDLLSCSVVGASRRRLAALDASMATMMSKRSKSASHTCRA